MGFFIRESSHIKIRERKRLDQQSGLLIKLFKHHKFHEEAKNISNLVFE